MRINAIVDSLVSIEASLPTDPSSAMRRAHKLYNELSGALYDPRFLFVGALTDIDAGMALADELAGQASERVEANLYRLARIDVDPLPQCEDDEDYVPF